MSWHRISIIMATQSDKQYTHRSKTVKFELNHEAQARETAQSQLGPLLPLLDGDPCQSETWMAICRGVPWARRFRPEESETESSLSDAAPNIVVEWS